MSERISRQFQFSLRTVLALLLVIGAALGFWLQEQRLAKARRILAAHGLAMEWADLKPGEVRATVTDRVESDSYVLLTVLVESRQPGSIAILKSGNQQLGAMLEQRSSESSWTGEVRILVDKVASVRGTVIKTVISAGQRGNVAQITSIELPGDNPSLTESIRPVADDSTAFPFGEHIPLTVGERQFELAVQ
jgi:hypothetical protein